MPHEALVIDDDPEVREMVAEILDSLGHRYDMATCQDEARKLLCGKRYSYYLVDLEIPVRTGKGLPRIQNGENLIAEIVQQRGTRKEPIIVITGHGKQGPELAVRMMKLGAADYVTKPFPPTGETLDNAIREALASSKPAAVEHRESSDPAKVEPAGRFSGGEMVFYSNRVELCGAVVLRGRCLMRHILDELRSRQANGKSVAIGGAALAKKLGLLRGQNAIAEAVKDFRNTVAAVLDAQGVTCGRQDVIQSGGPGYRLTEWIEVRDAHRADNDGYQPGGTSSG